MQNTQYAYAIRNTHTHSRAKYAIRIRNTQIWSRTHSPSREKYTIRIRNTHYAEPLTGRIHNTHLHYAYAMHSTHIGSRILRAPQIRKYTIRKLGHGSVVDRRYVIHNTQTGSRPFAQYTNVPFNTQISIHCVNCIYTLSSVHIAAVFACSDPSPREVWPATFETVAFSTPCTCRSSTC